MNLYLYSEYNTHTFTKKRQCTSTAGNELKDVIHWIRIKVSATYIYTIKIFPTYTLKEVFQSTGHKSGAQHTDVF